MNIKTAKNTVWCVGLSALFMTISSAAFAATCVPASPDGAGLQDCLDSTAPGDTVLLDPGIYVPTRSLPPPFPQRETFFIGKTLTIMGSGPGVVLSGNLGAGVKAFNVVVINADAAPGLVSLENLTIEDGDSSGGGFFVGGGIIAAANQTISLDNVTVQNNRAFLGGGLWLGDGPTSTWTINNSHFLNNVAVADGGAIQAQGTQLLVIRGGTFDGNTANGLSGGAVNFQSFGALQVSDAEFSNNTADESGGAISVRGVGFGRSYVIERSTFRDNATVDVGGGGGFGGAIDIFDIIGDGRVTDSRFDRNRATLGGGAIYFTHGTASVENNTFRENSADRVAGAIGIQGDGSGERGTNLTLEGNMFTDNNGSSFGGAVFAYDISGGSGSSLTLTKNHYRRNSADVGGAVVVGSVESVNENVTLFKEHFDFNWATSDSGGLVLGEVVSGSIDELHFNHNDANDAPHSLLILDSPDLDIGKVKVAGEDEDDCLVNGDPNCP